MESNNGEENKPLESMTPDDLDNLRVEKEKELIEAEKSASIIKDECLSLSRQILELRIKKNQMDQEFERARFVVKRLQSEIKVITSKFWQSRRP